MNAPVTQPTVLITSFQPWLSHQAENSSDVLLGLIEDGDERRCPEDCILLRKLPVNFVTAPQLVWQAVERDRPRIVVACGMAEGRSLLTVEQFARRGDKTLGTQLPLEQLIAGLPHTKISDNAGDFVCNSLYFDLLDGIAHGQAEAKSLGAAVFVHVPVLNDENRLAIAADFTTFLGRLKPFLKG